MNLAENGRNDKVEKAGAWLGISGGAIKGVGDAINGVRNKWTFIV